MPDEFVPLDTLKYTMYHRQLAAKSVIVNANLRYVDEHRRQLQQQYKTFDDFRLRFEVPRQLIEQIKAEGEKQHVKPKDEAELQATLPRLRTQLKALIARDLWDMSEYFSIFNEQSDIVRKALELLKSEE